MFKVPRDTKGAILKQCLKTEGHSDLSEVVDIIIMRVSFMWLFWGSLLWLPLLVMLPLLVESLLKVDGDTMRVVFK